MDRDTSKAVPIPQEYNLLCDQMSDPRTVENSVFRDDELLPAEPESKSRTLLRGMLAALDGGDEVKYFACFEALQTVTLEMLEQENSIRPGG